MCGRFDHSPPVTKLLLLSLASKSLVQQLGRVVNIGESQKMKRGLFFFLGVRSITG